MLEQHVVLVSVVVVVSHPRTLGGSVPSASNSLQETLTIP